jgi:hypothetical protein
VTRRIIVSEYFDETLYPEVEAIVDPNKKKPRFLRLGFLHSQGGRAVPPEDG